jgi:AraC-like DNA-binding protein
MPMAPGAGAPIVMRKKRPEARSVAPTRTTLGGCESLPPFCGVPQRARRPMKRRRMTRTGQRSCGTALPSSGDDLVAALRRFVRAALAKGMASGDEAAKSLNLHRRTLHRRLRARGTTFQRVLDGVRFEVACKLLADAVHPMSEVSARLGYAEPSAFGRAFRRWSGTSPLRWRDLTVGR